MSVTFPRRRLGPPVILLLAWLVLVPPAAAHAELQATFPEAGSTVDTPPRTIAARFSQALEPDSSIELLGPDGSAIATGGIDPADGRRLIINLDQALEPGEHEVRWQAFSEDGHLERGTFSFTVATPPPTQAPTATPAASATPPPSATPLPPTAEPTLIPLPSPSASPTPSPASGSDVLIPIVAAVVIVGGLGLYLLRGRR